MSLSATSVITHPSQTVSFKSTRATQAPQESKPQTPKDTFESPSDPGPSIDWAKLGRTATKVATGVAGAAVGIAGGLAYGVLGGSLGSALGAAAPVVMLGATALGLYYAFNAESATTRAFAGAVAGATASALALSSGGTEMGAAFEFLGDVAGYATTFGVIASGIKGGLRGWRLPDAVAKSLRDPDTSIREFYQMIDGEKSID